MIIENLHQPYSIEYTTINKGEESAHQHSFFELVYVISGTGIQCINNSQFSYHENHMFLITPEDCHSFHIESDTTFFFLRFNDIYISNEAITDSNVQKLEYILQNANHKPGCILCNLEDKQIVKPIIEAIIREYKNKEVYNQELVIQYINTLILIVARNITRRIQLAIPEQHEERASQILQYIQTNIYYPEKLKAQHVSEIFSVSTNYLGKYFKNQTGSTMQAYISKYKLNLIEHRLMNSTKRIKEIMHEFGFTDESHLNKFFKRYHQVSPRQFRKEKLHTKEV